MVDIFHPAVPEPIDREPVCTTARLRELEEILARSLARRRRMAQAATRRRAEQAETVE